MAPARHDSPADALVDRLLIELDELPDEDIVLLAELWSQEDRNARGRAWQRAKVAIQRSGSAPLLDRARMDVGRWMLAGPADYQGIGGDLLGRAGEHVSFRRLAAPAVLDAIAGLLAEPHLHVEDADVLLRPWRLVRDEPTR